MDEQNAKQDATSRKEMTDAEVLSAVKKRLDKVNNYFDENRITLGWRIIFTFVILANLIPLFFFLMVVSATLFPNPASVYIILLFSFGYVWSVLYTALAILLSTILSVVLFIFIQKPRGRALDFCIRAIYITVIVYLFPLILYFFNTYL